MIAFLIHLLMTITIWKNKNLIRKVETNKVLNKGNNERASQSGGYTHQGGKVNL